MLNAVGYYRVSTKKQGKSGLGLDAQKMLVEEFAERRQYKIINEFIEIETGSKNDRPILQKALKICKRNNAVLLIAKLDRLARNVVFIGMLIEAKVKFIVTEYPDADKFMLQMLAVYAERERDLASTRTKSALYAAKMRGVILGAQGRNVLSKLNRIKAKRFARDMEPKLEKLRLKGMGMDAMAKELNRLKVPTYRKDQSKWHYTTVRRIIKRLAIDNYGQNINTQNNTE